MITKNELRDIEFALKSILYPLLLKYKSPHAKDDAASKELDSFMNMNINKLCRYVIFNFKLNKELKQPHQAVE